MKNKTISIIGLGYIGLPTAILFASNGVKVIGLDIHQHIIDTLNQGNIHIVEPGLAQMLKDVVNKGMFSASLSAEKADVFIIAVPTPFKDDDRAPDLSYIKAAASTIAPVLEKGNIVILESTSPVGTTAQLVSWLAKMRPDLAFPLSEQDDNIDIYIAYCPERVLTGQILQELVEDDRIIGGLTAQSSQKVAAVYRTFVKGKLLLSNAHTAEMVKLTENAYRDVNIAFANEISLICERLNINVWELINLANHHPRVDMLNPSVGVGGHCVAVDPWFIINKTPDLTKLILSARLVNNNKPTWVSNKIRETMNNLSIVGRKAKLALLGLAFKPDTDDLRESPALKIAKILVNLNLYEIMIVEPNIPNLPEGLEKAHFGHLNNIEGADVVAILVHHQEFVDLQLSPKQKILNFVSK